MISIEDLSVSFGAYTLLDQLNFHISEGEHVALVGKNGAGKSTIMKLIMGLESPSLGRVSMPSDLKLAYLPQIMDYPKHRTILEDTMLAFGDIFALNDRVKEINNQIDIRNDYESESYSELIVELNDITERLRMINSDSPELQAERTLLGLGFRKEDLHRSRSTFSQGWNMRVELAKVLLRRPDVILLDEPTNHLDIESIQWLEDYLRAYSGALILVSHDRRFLDAVTKRTIEVMLGKVYDYKVPYTQYKELRSLRISQQQAAYANQQKMIEKTEEFIERFRYKATKSNQVQSRIKALDKVDRISIDEDDISSLNIKFPPSPRSGNVVFQTKDLSGGYLSKNGEKIVFSKVDLSIERGQKVAFLGRNGEGKSTMVKHITSELFPISGTAEVGYNVNYGYFAQNQEDILDKNLTVWDTLDQIAVGDIRTKLRDILAAFLFKGDDIDKKVGVLSGGERSRLAMAKLMLNPYNLLILDEPTNHMDIRSKEIIKQALCSYDGTVILVSHDRDFLEGLVDKVYEFRDGKVKEFLGGIDDFLQHRKLESLKEIEKLNPPLKEVEKRVEVKQSESKLSFLEQKELRKKQKQQEALEKKISDVEAAITEIELKLNNCLEPKDIEKLTADYVELKNRLDSHMEEWLDFDNNS